jgi:flagellar protein FlbD
MIPVTTLGGARVVVNVDLITRIEQTPDTLLSFVNGEKLAVCETPADVVARAVRYKGAIMHGADADEGAAP